MRMFRLYGEGSRHLTRGVSMAYRIWRKYYHEAEQDAKASYRLDCLDRFSRGKKEGLTAGQSAQIVGVSLPTLYRWRRRYKEEGALGLCDASRRPHRCRGRTVRTKELEATVLALRRQYGWGKRLLAERLRHTGAEVSDSSVGRIVSELLSRRQISRSVGGKWGRRLQRGWQRAWAQRRRGKAQVRAAGEVLQVDTVHAQVYPDWGCKIFTCRDMKSNWSYAMAASGATAASATRFLQALIADAPFRVKAIQVDGGSEFRGVFEAYCSDNRIPLHVIPPASPKSNSKVENFNGTLRREFLNFRDDLPDTVADMNIALRDFCNTYNEKRPNLGLPYRDGRRLRYFAPIQYIHSIQHMNWRN